MAERATKSKAKAAPDETTQPPGSDPSEAAPLSAPEAKPVRVDAGPPAGAPNAVAPHAPLKDPSVRLTDEQGGEVDIEDILEYPTPEKPGTLVRVTQRVYRTHVPMNAKRPSTQLMYPAGALISIFEAERVKAEVRAAQKAAQEQQDA